MATLNVIAVMYDWWNSGLLRSSMVCLFQHVLQFEASPGRMFIPATRTRGGTVRNIGK